MLLIPFCMTLESHVFPEGILECVVVVEVSKHVCYLDNTSTVNMCRSTFSAKKPRIFRIQQMTADWPFAVFQVKVSSFHKNTWLMLVLQASLTLLSRPGGE
jgi:hypothetical protein